MTSVVPPNSPDSMMMETYLDWYLPIQDLEEALSKPQLVLEERPSSAFGSELSMEDQRQDYDRPLQDALAVINNYGRSFNKFTVSEFKISTMTVLIMLNYRINLDKLQKRYMDTDVVKFMEKHGQWNMKKSGGSCFYNCVLLSQKRVVQKDNKKGSETMAIKVFSNGNLHMTGVKSISMALQQAEMVRELMGLVYENDVFEIVEHDVLMVNGYFKLNLPQGSFVCLKTLYDLLCNDSKHFCMFNNDQHAGVMIKMLQNNGSSKVSVMVFDSGNILISAFVNGSQAIAAYEFVTQFIQTNYANVIKEIGTIPTDCRQSAGATEFDYSKFIVLR
jgi:TATA-box binding protein (TBP) (component of TFIID and TFIIIB)